MKKFNTVSNRSALFFFGVMATAAIFPESALASSSIAEFTAPLESFLEVLTGPVVRVIGIISLVICSLMLAFQWSSMDDSYRKIAFILIGLSGAMASNKIIASWFNFSGALI